MIVSSPYISAKLLFIGDNITSFGHLNVRGALCNSNDVLEVRRTHHVEENLFLVLHFQALPVKIRNVRQVWRVLVQFMMEQCTPPVSDFVETHTIAAINLF